MKPIKIIYEDNDILVILKPSGIVVNRAETVKGETIQDWAEKRWKMEDGRWKMEKTSDFRNRSGVVHRLDKETSGLLLIAKNEAAFLELQRQFKEREIKKKYLILVHGKLEVKEGKIEAPVARNPFNREKFGVFLGGREAVTEYKILRNYDIKILKDQQTLSLVKVYPKTGRTHQIRVHFKYLNHPLVSDSLYLGRKQLRRDKEWCSRLFLHAYYLKFKHPKTGKELVLKADLPEDLSRVLKTLQGNMEEKGNRRIEI